MTSHQAKDIVENARDNENPFNKMYLPLIINICGGLDSAGKKITKENMKIVLNGFAISITLDYVFERDLEPEIVSILTNDLIDEMTNIMWGEWLKGDVERIQNRKKGGNVFQLTAVN